MAKYDPLRDHLRRQHVDALELSFAEMERRIGYMLPGSASLPLWWESPAEGSTASVQHRAWGEAGFDAVLVVGQDRVRFTRLRRVTRED